MGLQHCNISMFSQQAFCCPPEGAALSKASPLWAASPGREGQVKVRGSGEQVFHSQPQPTSLLIGRITTLCPHPNYFFDNRNSFTPSLFKFRHLLLALSIHNPLSSIHSYSLSHFHGYSSNLLFKLCLPFFRWSFAISRARQFMKYVI